MNICAKSARKKFTGSIFPIAFSHFVSLCHILVILPMFQTFSLLLYFLWWLVVFIITKVCWMLWWLALCQFGSVTQSCPMTLCNPMDGKTPGLPVHYKLLEFAQTHVYWVRDVIQISHPLSSPSPPTFNLSQHQGLFKWIISLHQVAKVVEFQLQHQSFQWIFRTDFL